jgi:hypothetical protein
MALDHAVQAETEDVAAGSLQTAPSHPRAPNVTRLPSGAMLLAAARIQAEAEQAHPDAASAGRKNAKSIAEQVRTSIPGSLLQFGAGGELVPVVELVPVGTGQEDSISGLVNTIANPDYVSADASRARLELANRAGILESALDAADTIGAQNSLEKMLAHQLATVHQATMKLARQVNRRIDRLEYMNLGHAEADRMTVEACRLANTMVRMTAGFQQGLVTLQRLRTGGTQRVLVQHVTVEGGGQAVVAGEMKTGGAHG